MEIKLGLFEFMLLYVLLTASFKTLLSCLIGSYLCFIILPQKLIIIRSYTNNNKFWRCSYHCWLPIGHNCQTQPIIGCWYYLNNMVSVQVITKRDDHLVCISFLCVMLSSGFLRQLLKSNLWAHSFFWEDDELSFILWFGHRATWS